MAASRFQLGSLTPTRVAIAIARRLGALPDVVSWRLSPRGQRNRARLETFRDRHRGQRCVLMANGPGLAKIDFRLLADQVTIAFNRSYVAFPSFGFTPSYFMTINDLVLEQFHADIAALPMPKVLSWRRRSLFAERDDVVFVRTLFSWEDDFRTELRDGNPTGATVTYMALQLAYFMGFREVVLVGLDHRFAHLGTPNAMAREADASHFVANYFPPGTRWELPDVHRMTVAYGRARRAYEAAGRRIIDASVDGACTVFEKAPLEEVLRREPGAPIPTGQPAGQ